VAINPCRLVSQSRWIPECDQMSKQPSGSLADSQRKSDNSPVGDAVEAVVQGGQQGGVGGMLVVGSVAAVALAGIFGYRLVKKLRSGGDTTASPPDK
jgi:hypothetical protein